LAFGLAEAVKSRVLLAGGYTLLSPATVSIT